ncbi:unnamed protein product [Rotaria sordida]|uniref:NAD(+)--protein-arginine ADP-ribosyltransferase n=1 Tax=Rotaria sordida TaxID=392033 RepID=A0A818XZL9_9BILA|nr:unnamed protein product [Rotaria sordida]CAF0826580.1 unnamed protein product [Rotaria sordida]CAF3545938.1 unnamed protein product [Rotaria sordida]CAF3747418.1 unnamed protein product [Rotaria sordida]
MGSYGDIELHVASYNGHNEFIQLLLTDSALKSFENISNSSAFYNQSRIDEIEKLYQQATNLCHLQENIQDSDYIEWSLIGDNLIKKCKKFREQIDLYKTYDNHHHLITKLLIEIIDYYLNEYLIEQEHLSRHEAKTVESYFKQAIEEQNYLKYFIKAYTLTNNFYRVLNKHLALYILDYFDTASYSSLPTKYRLINCLVHIVTLVINHPDIHKYRYEGICFRGLLMTKKDLKNYAIGNHILNRSFLSTSKSCTIAKIFADNSQQNTLEETSQNDRDLSQVSVLLKYKIKQNQTAIDIEHLSMIPDEKEVLILPFSVFQVKDRIRNSSKTSSPVLYEIDLEECEEYKETNNRKDKSSCPTMINRSVWNGSEPRNYTILSTPVPYIGIYHTTGSQCTTLDSCMSITQDWQRFHMDTRNWSDIGYNFLVGGDGYIFEGRGWNYTGAHCRGYNPQSIGIGVIGDYTSIQPSKSLVNAVISLITCGISFGFIQANYTFLGHWGYGIIEYYMLHLNRSSNSIQYCLPTPTTVSLK